MSFPLYEYDQVLTLDELVAIARHLSQWHDSIPRWRVIRRFQARVQFAMVVHLIDVLRVKPALADEIRTLNQGENR